MNLLNNLFIEFSWQKLIVFLILSAGPVLFWLFLCLRLDRSAPEPPRQIIKMFFYGALITVPIVILANILTNVIQVKFLTNPILIIFILSFFVDGLIEETGKYLILKQKIYYSRHFDELRDGFVYGMVIGLGLSFAENILYGFSFFDISSGISTILLRGFTSVFIHFLTGGVIGYHLGLSKFNFYKKPNLIVWRGLIIAILLHGLYNTIVRFGWWWNLLPLATLLITVFILILIKIKKLSFKIHLPVPKK
jgi:RsiW-degrading membrane proteinase PrsW (M82 family)